MKNHQVQHFRKNCIGCNACVVHAPENWSINQKDGQADLRNGIKRGDSFVSDIMEDELNNNIEAAAHCPMNIIKIHHRK